MKCTKRFSSRQRILRSTKGCSIPNKPKLKVINNSRSEGELFLENFLGDQKIKFKPEKVIRNLRNDVAEYRVADFYLLQYKIYIEFQGLWNNTKEDRERYKEKMRVYGKNEIPCMYLYPENLGIIDYVFHVRMLETLKKFNLKVELKKYKFFRFLRQKLTMLLWFLFFIYFEFMQNALHQLFIENQYVLDLNHGFCH